MRQQRAIRLTVEAGVFGSDPLDLHVLWQRGQRRPLGHDEHADLNLKIAHSTSG